ncbi:MAG TPA: polysaccharide deacetylase family protein [Spirochaetaceae bacterium]|nr:polysaccharide deacetylase family protein [Spirochaetaceae bacterium]HAX36673.1 polysaccharide deacetylase family protein [Spirochaetaceae bacterium]HCQ88013.1 polysaccharide deacetylase family protein [Spirochaetaceae bacterium]
MAAFCLFFAFTALAYAGLEFVGPDIGSGDNILFTARVDIPGEEGYDSLFVANAANGRLEQLTFYPEAIALLDDGQRLQIRNRFGIFMTERGFGGLQPVRGLPSFAQGSAVQQGRLVDSRPSPDGSMMLYLSPSSVARASLILFDLGAGSETVVARDIEFSVDRFPARWSPNSQYFIYSRDGQLYYFSTDQLRTKRVLEESWRGIGAGRIEQARWSNNGNLYVLRDRSLYRIMPAEFFTQAIYAGIIPPGTLVGKAPFAYDPNFDSFYMSPDGAKVLLCKDGRNIFLYHLDPDDFGREDSVSALPYLFLQGNTTIQSVLWPASDKVTVFTGSLEHGQRVSGAYRIDVPARDSHSLSASFSQLDVRSALSMSLSPDESRIALCTGSTVLILSYADWRLRQSVASPGARHALWIDSGRLVVAGAAAIEVVSLADDSRQLIAFGQVDGYGWSEAGALIVKVTDRAYTRDLANRAWLPAATYAARTGATSNGNYRVYTDAIAAGSYRNLLMVRSVSGLGTRSLVPAPARSYRPFPAGEEANSPLVFDHGSRLRRREVSLVINAYDGAEGLMAVLEALRLYDLTATFFLNGEFIRRNPGAARLIAESGHEVGNMFFSTFDPTDARYRIDQEFIQRGLARTEDDYFEATGRELSLLWHTPHYSSNSLLLQAAVGMNYTYIGRDIDSLDWVDRLAGSTTPGLYQSTHQLVERITELAKPGSIIPIRLGVPMGGRDSYLFNELPLLINALLGEGFAIVPVSALLENAR